MKKILAFAACLALAASSALAQVGPPIGPGNGGGGGSPGGGVSNVATGCGSTGGPITTTGTISDTITINAQTGTSYSFLATDCGKLVTFTNAANIAGSLVSANFVAGNFVYIRNLSGAAGVLTITPTTGTIDGAASLTLQPTGAGVLAVYNGTNWTTTGSVVTGVQSISTSCPTSGPTTGVVTLAPSAGRTVSASTDTIAATDCGSVIEYQNATSTAVSLTAAATLGAGWCVNISVDTGAGTVTVTSAGGNFNTTGTTALTIAATIGTSICVNAAATGFNVGGAGTGNASGPGSSVDGDVALFNGTTGKIIKDSGVSIASASLDTSPGYVAGSGSAGWTYTPLPRRVAATGLTGAVNTVYCTYAFVSQTVTIDKLGVLVPTTVGTTNFNLAVYSSVSGRPGALLASTGNFVNTSTGYLSGIVTGNYQLKQGVPYWFCQMTGDATAVMNGYDQSRIPNAPDIGAPSGSETSVLANAGQGIGVQCAAANCTGTASGTTFPTTLTGSTWTITASVRAPAIAFHALSVP